MKNKIKELPKAKELLKLVQANPDLPIIAYVNSEIVGGDCYYWLGEFTNVSIREYAKVEPYNYYEMNIVWKDDYTEYMEYLMEQEEWADLSNEEAENKALDIINNLEYTKVICVYVDLPNHI